MKAYCLNLSLTDQDLIEKFYGSKGEDYEIVDVKTFSDLQVKTKDEENPICFYCAIDSNVQNDELEEFLSKYVNDTVHIIMKEKLFDRLLLCHRYNVLYVYEYRLDLASMETAYIKEKYLSGTEVEYRNLPNNVTSLFARAIKIKSSEELFYSLNRYLSSCRSVRKFSYLVEKKDRIKNYGEAISSDLKKKILKYEWKKKYIGNMFRVGSDGEFESVAFPVFMHEEAREFVYLEVSKTEVEIILNDFFFNYLESVLIYRSNKRKESKLQKLVNLDEVTGAYNTRKLMTDLAEQIERHDLKKQKFCVLFIDIDHFKNVNDSYGHLVGSKLLVQLADYLKKQLRETDLIYRYGGDEFVIIMPYLDTETVSKVAERLLKTIKGHTFIISEEETYKMSVSIGISEYPTDALTEKEIIKFADDMMYKSKKSGRGKVFYLNKVGDC